MEKEKDYWIVDNIKEVVSVVGKRPCRYLITGFAPSPDKELYDELLSRLGTSDGIYLFFDRILDQVQRNAYVSSNKYIKIEPSGLNLGVYIRNVLDDIIEFDNIIDNNDFVKNTRPYALKSFEEFNIQSEKIFCNIAGVRGIGKKTFLKELKTLNIGGLHNTIEINKVLSTNFDDIIEEIVDSFRIEVDIMSSTDKQAILSQIAKHFWSFSKVNLIILGIDAFSKSNGVLNNSDCLLFLKSLLRHKTRTSKNHIYLLSNVVLQIDRENEILINSFTTILLKPFSREKSIEILYQTLVKQFEKEFAYIENNTKPQKLRISQIREYDNIIECLAGGHAYILTNILATKINDLGIDDFFDLYTNNFKIEKDELLKNWIKLSTEEQQLLSFLAFFDDSFPVSAIGEFYFDTSKIIKQFMNRMFIEKVSIGGTNEYKVCTFLVDFLKDQVENPNIYRERISWFYQKQRQLKEQKNNSTD